ncbi:MAG: hypothetical protein RL148_2217 [Planctomycetota bacterium]|jgi:putative endonuclease
MGLPAPVSRSTSAVWWLYVVRTAHGALYTGITTDVARRVAQHADGSGARSLRGKGPLQLAARWRVGNRSEALVLEARLKRLPRAHKLMLVERRRPLAVVREVLAGIRGLP